MAEGQVSQNLPGLQRHFPRSSLLLSIGKLNQESVESIPAAGRRGPAEGSPSSVPRVDITMPADRVAPPGGYPGEHGRTVVQ